MHTPRVPRRWARLSTTSALIATMMLIASSMAIAWPMQGQNPQNTRQATATGPEDPGRRWSSDVTTLGDYAVAGLADVAGGSANNAPLVSEDGTVIIRAWDNAASQAVLIGLDPDDGDLAWTIDGVARRCGSAMDSNGQLWALLDPASHDEIDTFAVRAFDPATGTPVGDAWEIADDWSATLCNGTRMHIGEFGDLEFLVFVEPDGLMAFEVGASGYAHFFGSRLWSQLDVDGIVQQPNEAQSLAFTDEGLVLGVDDDDELVVHTFDVWNGAFVDEGVKITLYDRDGATTGLSEFLNPAVRFLAPSDDRLVVGFSHQARGNEGSIHGIDLGTGSLLWGHRHEARTTTAGAGPTQMALSGDNVVHNARDGHLHGVNVRSGDKTSWSGDLSVRELGGGMDFDVVTDSAGNIYSAQSPGTGQQMQMVRFSPSGATDWSFPVSALPGVSSSSSNLRVAGVTGDGDLVLYGQTTDTHGQIHMIDNSGGLKADTPADTPCELPFDDVTPGATHADNICRLVELEVTRGLDATTYDPRGLVTREQMATFLRRAVGLAEVSGGSGFLDVTPGSTHAGSIYAVRDADIAQGVTTSEYQPRANVTREQMATFLMRAADLDPVPGGSGFVDVQTGSTHTGSIYAVRDAEIAKGVTTSEYQPRANVTREQMATFLVRMIDHINDQG